MERTRTTEELNLIDTIQLDISVAADKASSILQFVIDDYFDRTKESFENDDAQQAALICSYEGISNMLFAASDYIYQIKQIVKGTENKGVKE